MKTFVIGLLATVLTTAAFSQPDDLYFRTKGKFSLGAKVGPAFPVSEFANTFKIGYTGLVELSYHFTPQFDLFTQAGFSKFDIDNNGLSSELGKQYQGIATSVTAPYQVIPIVVGLNISYPYPKFWPYFTMSIGAYFQKLETSGTFVYNGTTTALTPKTQNWSQVAYGFGLGTLIPIGDEGWTIDLNAKFNSVIDYEGKVLITAPDGSDVSTRAIRFVSALVGLNYTFH